MKTLEAVQRERAESLVGKKVRFANLPTDCQPTSILVTEALPNGMIRLLNKTGYYAAHLFVVVDPPEDKSA